MKKKVFTSTMLAIAGIGLVVGSANATPVFGDGGAAVQAALNTITTGGTSSVVASTDFLPDSLDQTWSLTASGGSVSNIILEDAGYANLNSFGIFDATDITKTVELFGGAAAPGAQATVSINDLGQVFINQVATGVNFSEDYFGYYLASGDGNTYYSISGYNIDGLDHMAAYQGTGDEVKLPTWPPGSWTANEYILAWEDLAGGGDGDFNDFVAMVESVEPVSAAPVPEPATMLLLGAGFAGLGAVRRRKAKK